MKHDTKVMLSAVGFFGALGAVTFWGIKRAQAAKAVQPQPQVIPAAVPQAVPAPAPKAPPQEVHVSPDVSIDPASPYGIPPEQWTQEQAATVTSDQGNAARDAVGKVFGF